MVYTTRAWVIGILIGSLIATIVVAYFHIAELLAEPSNPVLHILQDWIIVLIPLFLVIYLIVKIFK